MRETKINYSLGPLERAVLKIAWIEEKVCVRHVLEKLSKDLSPAYTTVMTVMNRMVDKGVLEREKPSNTCYYQPTESKEEFLSQFTKIKLQSIINQYGIETVPILQKQIGKIS